MGESVEVVTSELHLAADRLRGAGQRLQDGLSAVDLETSNLLASGWKGEAATAFDTYWEQWHNGAGQVVRALQTMSEALDTAATNYQAADEQAGGALGSTMQTGGGSGTGGGGGAPTGAGAAGADVAGGSTGSPSGLAEQMNLGETMAPMSQAAGIPAQVAGQVAGGLMQAGTMAAGAAQQAVQAATQLAQEAQAAAAESEAVEAGSEMPESEAATGAKAPAGPAPVEAPPAGVDTSRPEETPGRSL